MEKPRKWIGVLRRNRLGQSITKETVEVYGVICGSGWQATISLDLRSRLGHSLPVILWNMWNKVNFNEKGPKLKTFAIHSLHRCCQIHWVSPAFWVFLLKIPMSAVPRISHDFNPSLSLIPWCCFLNSCRIGKMLLPISISSSHLYKVHFWLFHPCITQATSLKKRTFKQKDPNHFKIKH